MSEKTEFHCLVPFKDTSESFVLGFEAGMVWQRMLAGDKHIGGDDEAPTHFENMQVFQSMADTMDYEMQTIWRHGDGWMTVLFTKKQRRFKVISGGVSND